MASQRWPRHILSGGGGSSSLLKRLVPITPNRIFHRSISFDNIKQLFPIFSNDKQLTEDWTDVGLVLKSGVFPNIIRKDLAGQIRSAFRDKTENGEQKNGEQKNGQKGNGRQGNGQYRNEKDFRRCVILIGAKGVGKSTLVRQTIKLLRDAQEVHEISFDFETVKHSNFVAFLVAFYSSFLAQLQAISNSRPSNSRPSNSRPGSSLEESTVQSLATFIFKTLSLHYPQFDVVVQNFIEDIKSKNYPSGISSCPSMISGLTSIAPGSDGQHTFNHCCLTAHRNRTSWASNAAGGPLTICLSILAAIGEYEENTAAYVSTKGRLQSYPTGERTLRYLLTLTSEIQRDMNAEICLTLKNVEALTRSTFAQERAQPFISLLVHLLTSANESMREKPEFEGVREVTKSGLRSALKINEIDLPCVITTDDSLLLLRLLHVPHVPVLDLLVDNESDEETPDPHATPDLYTSAALMQPVASRVRVVNVGEFGSVLTRQIYGERVTDNSIVVEGVIDSVGGHPVHLKKLAESIQKEDRKFHSLVYCEEGKYEMLKGLREGYEEEIDLVAFIPQHLVDFERYRRQQFCVRGCLENTFPRELLAFQWKTNFFLSLPILEQLRMTCRSRVAFSVTVLETIRVLLGREYWLIEDDKVTQLQHPVILALLDARLMRLEIQPTRLLPYDTLTRRLLASFVNAKVGEFSMVDRLKYNMTLAQNKEEIAKRAGKMTSRWN